MEKIEQYVKELEAVKHYDQVKRERYVLARKVESLEAEVSELKKSLAAKRSLTRKLKEELKQKANETEELNKNVKKLSSETLSLREVTRIVGDKKLTLPQLRELVTRVKAEEIQVEAGKVFAEFKSSWEKKEKPKEVFRASCDALAEIIEHLKKPKPHYFSKELGDLGLPTKVEKMLKADVDKRITNEFLRRVEAESDKKASEKLEALKNIEWPRWYSSNVQPKIAQLESLILGNVFKMLQEPRPITCDKCGMRFGDFELTSNGIDDLIRTGYVEIECQNTDCTDSFLFSTWRHKIKISLSDLISNYLTESL